VWLVFQRVPDQKIGKNPGSLASLLFFQKGAPTKDFFAFAICGEDFQNPSHRDSHPANTGLSPALTRFYREAVKGRGLSHLSQVYPFPVSFVADHRPFRRVRV
jgi:hypothetical protein